MKSSGSSLVDRVGLEILRRALFYGTLTGTVLVGLLLVDLGERHKLPGAIALLLIDLVAGLGAAFLVVPEIIRRMRQDEAVLLGEATGQVLRSYLTLAAFLPVVGPFLERLSKPREKNPFTQD
jgi:nitrate/nitrite transporter NarK